MLTLAAALATCAVAPAVAAPGPQRVVLPPAPDDPVPTDPGTIVGVKRSGDVAPVTRALRGAGLRAMSLPRIDALFLPRVGAGPVRRVLARSGRVRWIEPTRPRALLAEPSSSLDTSTGRPFDWAYDAVNAGPAIAAVGGGSAAAVAVVDSGVDATHPDLAGHIGPGRDIAFGEREAKDAVGHGTFVAGLITAIDGNGIGTRGVAGNTTVVPVRVTTTGSITSANAAAGIVAAVDAGASVVNLSFGGPSLSAAERAALDYATSRNVLVVAAAGNTRMSGNAPVFPAAAIGGTRGGWSNGISVGAVDPNGQPAPFSTSNDGVTLSAPGAGSVEDCGDGVFSTIPQQATLWSDGGCLRTVSGTTASAGRYGYAEGTSFAAPIVAGGAALVRAANPRLSAAQTADVLRRTSRQTFGTGWNTRTGAGVVDLAAAVGAARRYDVTPPVPVVTATPSSGGVWVSVSVRDWSAYASEHAAVASVRLEGSSDGVTFAPIAPDATGAMRMTDPVGAGVRRWYRATACDANRNCGSGTAGPISSGAPSPTGSLVASMRPALASVSAGRPKGCGTCVTISFTAKGRGPLRWAADITGAGITLHRGGKLASARRHTVAVRLPRLPVCGGRMNVSLRLSSSLGQVRVQRTIRIVSGRCATLRAGARRAHR
ncbi:MAG TPA: S8 family serine peptidase [Miltoncostaeaceae bacterium]|nr:S8 family serine peptidase [Miltoncostaeaceae bacterium]